MTHLSVPLGICRIRILIVGTVRIVVAVVACIAHPIVFVLIVVAVLQFASEWRCHPSPFAVAVLPVLAAVAPLVPPVVAPIRSLAPVNLQRLPLAVV